MNETFPDYFKYISVCLRILNEKSFFFSSHFFMLFIDRYMYSDVYRVEIHDDVCMCVHEITILDSYLFNIRFAF